MADEISEAEALLGLVRDLPHYASELAISEVTQRTFNEIAAIARGRHPHAVDALARHQRRRTGVPPVAGRRRGALLRQIFGQEYASVLTQGGRGRLPRPESRRPRLTRRP